MLNKEHTILKMQKVLDTFIERVSQSQPSISTGFRGLDTILSGGIRPSLYVIGGMSSIGKTSFVLQIADYIAVNGCDVLYFNLEQSDMELTAKCLSRETQITASDILYHWNDLPAEKKSLVQGAIDSRHSENETYKNIFFVDCRSVAGIKEAINIYKKQYPDKMPVVIVDYLQIVEPSDNRRGGTDKQITDDNILALKSICINSKVPILAVSSFNRDNYNSPVNLTSFKESGAIEYSSDVLIGLQYRGQNSKFDFDKAKNENPRKVEAVVLKNRMGVLGKQAFDYYPEHNYFKEVKK